MNYLFAEDMFDSIADGAFKGCIIGLIVGVLIAVVKVLSKKQNANDEQIASALSPDVRSYLMNTPMRPVNGMPNAAAVAGYVHSVRKQNQQYVWFTVLYYNQYFPNLRDKIISCDVKVSIADAQAHGVAPNSAVTVLFNEDKRPQLIF
jgi:tetrahydromethanopterin S-methyltransferase subunit F